MPGILGDTVGNLASTVGPVSMLMPGMTTAVSIVTMPGT